MHISAKNHQKLSHIPYRPDIDGLRALAVLSVLVFHFFPSILPGGFIGVDIFFVISGYLISSIIINDLENKNFKFSEFYKRRIKRIFPALSVVLLFIMLMGWMVLLPSEYTILGKHIRSAATFLLNVVFYKDSAFQYFEPSSDYKPLMHLWSLSVEEQFYLLYPICIFLLYKIRRFTLCFLILAIVISFSLNIFHITDDPKASFFHITTRAWEMLLGAILSYLTFITPHTLNFLKHKTMRIVPIIGILCIDPVTVFRTSMLNHSRG